MNTYEFAVSQAQVKDVRGGEEELGEGGHVAVVGDGVLALGVLLRLVDRVRVDGVPAGNGRINVVVM